MRYVCKYSILRFLPYRETGEFANVGIILVCPEMGYFSFKLEKTRHKRLTTFFPNLDKEVFLQGVKPIENELLRMKPESPKDDAQISQAFDFITRPRKTLFFFSEPRSIMSDNPQSTLENLFDHYIDQKFATALATSS